MSYQSGHHLITQDQCEHGCYRTKRPVDRTMIATAQCKRKQELAIRLYYEIAWPRFGQTRYISCLIIPLVAGLMVPGWAWTGCLTMVLCAVAFDHSIDLWLRRRMPQLADGPAALTQSTVRQVTWRAAGLVALYTAPCFFLAFAPHPGPVIGLMFAMAAAIAVASQHVMTKSMIFHTFPVMGLGLLLNASQLGEGWISFGLVAFGAVACINAVQTSAAGALSFENMIAARLDAEAAAAELEQRVELRTAELIQATALAQSANKAKSVFLANMSHELRTPLNAVLGYSEMIQEDLAEGRTENCQKDLQRVVNASHHLLRLINEVLDLSRVEAGKLDLNWEKQEIVAIAHGAMDAIRPLATRNGTRCALIEINALGDQWVDATRLRQCLLNLLSNAAKFTENGEISLELSVVPDGANSIMHFVVRDTGPGMSPEGLKRLFSPFVQLDGADSRRHQGAGLGLTITRRLATLMGGDVQVESALGAGSAFTLSLPMLEAAPPKETSAQIAA